MTDYPTWMKPHLRRRLEEEAAAKIIHPKAKSEPTGSVVTAPQTAQGAAPSYVGGRARFNNTCPSKVVPGMRVIVKAPDDATDGPGWLSQMDRFAGVWVEVKTANGEIFNIVSAPLWSFCRTWITDYEI